MNTKFLRKKTLTPTTPFNRALKYLSFRQRSLKETHDYLKDKGYLESEITDTIKQLLELKFLNDDDFARTFTENRQRKGKSKRSIKFELKLKGINNEQVEEILEDAKSDFKTAMDYTKKHIRLFENYDYEKKQKKITSRLRSRGYGWDVISKVLKKIRSDK